MTSRILYEFTFRRKDYCSETVIVRVVSRNSFQDTLEAALLAVADNRYSVLTKVVEIPGEVYV